jgi:asparagine synthase (glutamine-hydrolysing)
MNYYLGGMQTRPAASPLLSPNAWRAIGTSQELFLDCRGNAVVRQDGPVAVLLRGTASSADSQRLEAVAEGVLRQYRQHGTVGVERLEGSFTVAVLDGNRERVLLYRNLAGSSFTYYRQTADGFAFASNLAELLAHDGGTPRVERTALPAYFLFRFVPGRQTLFQGYHRLQPGEEVVYTDQRLYRRQRLNFADLRDQGQQSDPVERLEETVATILRGQHAANPDTANLLSGGIDSTYLQAVWNRVAGRAGRSYSVSVDHPRSWPDTEYARSAARALQTQHTLVPANGRYIDYLVETLAATGEPPNHAFTVYFGKLARSLTAAGVPAALCGEGADSLFGIGCADVARQARWLRRWLPGRRLRSWGGRLARVSGHDGLAQAFLLAESIDQPRRWEHPVNQVAVFADWDLVRAALGAAGIDAALADRRALLDRQEVGDDLLERLHAVGYLGEAIDSASLWTTIFQRSGGDLCCPFLDSRLIRLALNLPAARRFPYRRPKGLLKQALLCHVPRSIVARKKLGFGQPIFEWLAPGGQLRPWAEQIAEYDFVPASVRAAALARPGWFLYSLLCYDLWHKLFIDRVPPADLLESGSSRPRLGERASLSMGVQCV